MIYSTTYLSPIGELTLACEENSLIGLWIEGQKYHGARLLKNMVEDSEQPIFDLVKHWLDSYFSGKKPDISGLSLSPIGTPFRRMIWDVLCEIPYGEVMTYGDIAKIMAEKMGKKSMSSQAVGGAVGHNPISIIIPCHRVVGANGKLTGYAGGIRVKAKLLELEGKSNVVI